MTRRSIFSGKETLTVGDVKEGFLTALIVRSPQTVPELVEGLQADNSVEVLQDRVTKSLRQLRGAGLIEAERIVDPGVGEPGFRYSITEDGTRHRQEQVAQNMGNTALGEMPDGLYPA